MKKAFISLSKKKNDGNTSIILHKIDIKCALVKHKFGTRTVCVASYVSASY